MISRKQYACGLKGRVQDKVQRRRLGPKKISLSGKNYTFDKLNIMGKYYDMMTLEI